MEANVLRGKWHQVRGEVRRTWGKLTDDDVAQIEGRVEKLIGIVQERYGKGRQQVLRDVKAFVKRHCKAA